MTPEELFETNFKYLKNYSSKLGPSQNKEACQSMVEDLKHQSSTINFHNDTFFLLVNLKDLAIPTQISADTHLAPHVLNNLSIQGVISLVHPNFLVTYLAFGHAAYKMMEEENIRKRLQTLDQQYVIQFPMLRSDNRYWWVKQLAVPMEVDEENRIISHLNKYTVIEPYIEGNIKKPIIQFGKGQDLRYDLMTMLLSYIPKEFLDTYLDFTKEQIKLIRFYGKFPNSNIKNVNEEIKINQHTVQKYNKIILKKVNNILHTNFTTGKKAAIFLDQTLGNYLYGSRN